MTTMTIPARLLSLTLAPLSLADPIRPQPDPNPPPPPLSISLIPDPGLQSWAIHLMIVGASAPKEEPPTGPQGRLPPIKIAEPDPISSAPFPGPSAPYEGLDDAED